MLPVLVLVIGCSSSSGQVASSVEPSSDSSSASPSPSETAAAPAVDLDGFVVVVDPGHNGGNGAHPAQINRLVDVVTIRKACDTTGTTTDDGYPESSFTWNVSKRVARELRARGATVVMTRRSNDGVGPCITERAAIGNQAEADAAISIHADGAAADAHGFHVIQPGDVGVNSATVAPSHRLALAVRKAYRSATGIEYSSYAGRRGIVTRTDLGGLNLSTVPKVFIECANMRNAAEARQLADPRFRQQAADGIAAGIGAFLLAEGHRDPAAAAEPSASAGTEPSR